MELEVLILTLLAATAFLAVQLATLLHVEFATQRAARHVDALAELSQPRRDTDVPAQVNTRSPHLRLVRDNSKVALPPPMVTADHLAKHRAASSAKPVAR